MDRSDIDRVVGWMRRCRSASFRPGFDGRRLERGGQAARPMVSKMLRTLQRFVVTVQVVMQRNRGLEQADRERGIDLCNSWAPRCHVNGWLTPGHSARYNFGIQLKKDLRSRDVRSSDRLNLWVAHSHGISRFLANMISTKSER